MDCIFCKIIAGEVEASKVYEDGEILAFMDNRPVHDGQVLVIPKLHVNHFSDISEDLAEKIFSRAHKISKKIKNTLSPERVGYVVHGYGVAHAHMILIPLHDREDIKTKDNGLAPSREELNNVAKILKD